MRPFLKSIPIVLSLYIVMACNNTSHKQDIAFNTKNTEAAIHVIMDGEPFGITQEQLEPNMKTKFQQDSILLVFWKDGYPFKLNFNLFNTNSLKTGSATFKVPESNAKKQLVDLNFYHADRDTKRINKRIVFRKGTIVLTKIDEHNLQMTFDGEGSGILESGNNFPISGNVNVTF